MPATMPAHLQGRFLAASWSEQRNSHVREFATESGKPTLAKFPGTPETLCSGQVILNEAECDDLEGFFTGPCAEGATPFWMEHPRKGTPVLCRWLGPCPIEHRAPLTDAAGLVTGLYSVACSLAIM